MDALYARGKRPTFRQGRLYTNKKVMTSEQVATYLAHPELLKDSPQTDAD